VRYLGRPPLARWGSRVRACCLGRPTERFSHGQSALRRYEQRTRRRVRGLELGPEGLRPSRDSGASPANEQQRGSRALADLAQPSTGSRAPFSLKCCPSSKRDATSTLLPPTEGRRSVEVVGFSGQAPLRLTRSRQPARW
jgi:hypothetical protein